MIFMIEKALLDGDGEGFIVWIHGVFGFRLTCGVLCVFKKIGSRSGNDLVDCAVCVGRR